MPATTATHSFNPSASLQSTQIQRISVEDAGGGEGAHSAFTSLTGMQSQGVHSPALAGRVVPIASRVFSDLRYGGYTEEVRDWLQAQGWTHEDLERMEQEENPISEVLLTQVYHKSNVGVLNALPPFLIYGHLVELRTRIIDLEEIQGQLEALHNLISMENQPQEEIFFEIVPGDMEANQVSYLLKRGWTEEDFDCIREAESVDGFVEAVAELALEKGDLDVLYNLPAEQYDVVRGVVDYELIDLRACRDWFQTNHQP